MSSDEIEKRARDLYAQARGNPNRLATMAAQFQLAAKERSPGGAISVLGGVSFATRKPYVQLEWGNEIGQLDVESARSHAQLVLEAVQNAVSDAAIVGWATDQNELGLDVNAAAQLIDAVRRYRHDKWGQPDLEIEFQVPPPEEEA